MKTIQSQLKRLAAAMAVTLAINGLTDNTFAIIITTSATAPSGNILISQTANSEPEQIRKRANTTDNWRELAQTFTITGNVTLDKISMLVSQDAGLTNTALNLFMNVWSATSTTSSNGTSLLGFPETGTTGTFATETKLWMTFDIADVALTPGTYGFTVGFNGAFNSGNQLADPGVGLNGFWLAATNPYAGGQAFRLRPTTGASDLSSGASKDFAFILQGYDTVAAVPEPSSAVLLALGGLLAWRRARK